MRSDKSIDVFTGKEFNGSKIYKRVYVDSAPHWLREFHKLAVDCKRNEVLETNAEIKAQWRALGDKNIQRCYSYLR